MSNNVLVIAFDGLDRELIEEYGLEDIRQSEYGSIDNSESISSIKTSELFASFITGENYERHNVKGLSASSHSLRERLSNRLFNEYLLDIRGFTALKEIFEALLRVNDRENRYNKSDLQVESLFDEVKDSRAMFVPSYNPDLIWEMAEEFEPLKRGFSVSETAKYWDERSYNLRKRKLFSELENAIVSPRAFLMCHFHRPDIYHHLYAEGTRDDTKLKKIYQETDDLAGEVKEKALEAGYDYIIFMSDHGLPTEDEHNENAFYSCNKELFGDETPHITDFHDKILELVERGSNGS